MAKRRTRLLEADSPAEAETLEARENVSESESVVPEPEEEARDENEESEDSAPDKNETGETGEEEENTEEDSGDESTEEDGAENEDPDENGDEDEEDEDETEQTESSLPLTSIVEAILFAAREPLKVAQIARAVGKRTRQDSIREAMEELNVQYLESGRAFEIAEISGKYQMMSRPEFAAHIMRIYPKREVTEKDKTQRLTPAMLDTLAIIAYKQPVMRSEIDHIRGASCANHLRALIERGTVREFGRRTDLVGKPAVFGTTERFLIEFGLGSIDELPMRNEFIEPGGPPPVEMAEAEDESGTEPEGIAEPVEVEEVEDDTAETADEEEGNA